MVALFSMTIKLRIWYYSLSPLIEHPEDWNTLFDRLKTWTRNATLTFVELHDSFRWSIYYTKNMSVVIWVSKNWSGDASKSRYIYCKSSSFPFSRCGDPPRKRFLQWQSGVWNTKWSWSQDVLKIQNLLGISFLNHEICYIHQEHSSFIVCFFCENGHWLLDSMRICGWMVPSRTEAKLIACE